MTPSHALKARGQTHVDEDVMKNLRVLVAAALALCGADAIRAQTPPPSGLYPSTSAPLNGAAVIDPSPGGVPLVVIGDNASPAVPKMWFDLAVNLSWLESTPMPSPLLTTSTPADMGVIGAPSTVVLAGQQRFAFGSFAGISFGSGGWWNADRTVGMDGSTLWTERRSTQAYFSSDGSPGSAALFRPIFDPVTQTETSVLVASPGLMAGDFLAFMSMQYVNGDTNLIFNIDRTEDRSWTALVGFRSVYLGETLTMTQDSIVLTDGAGFYLGVPLAAGNALLIQDRIQTINRLYLGQLGLRWDRNFGPVNVGLTYKFGFGWNDQRIFYDGRTTLNPPNAPVPGGILVQTSQPYRNYNERFAVEPDCTVRASVRITRRLRAFGTYNFTYISSVARPGNYIDRTVQLQQAPSQPQYTGIPGIRPQFTPSDDSFFAHGLTAGLTWGF
jgi:hypothetical protein